MNEAEEEQRERQVDEDIGSIGLGLRGMSVGGSDRNDERRGSASVSISASFDIGIPPPEMDRPILPSSQVYSQPLSIAQPSTQAKFDPSSYSPPGLQSHSLPSQHTRPWTTHSSGHPGRVSPIREESGLTSGAQSEERRSGGEDRPSNPVLDVTRTRMSNLGRGALYPGAVFKGTQTSGRSAYDVEVRFIVCLSTSVHPGSSLLSLMEYQADLSGCKLSRIIRIRLPIDIPPNRHPPTLNNILHRRNHWTQIRIHNRSKIRSYRA